MNRRIVITGIGPVSGIGTGVAEFTRGLRTGRNGVVPISRFDSAGFERKVAGEVGDFRPESLLRRLDVDDWGSTSLFAAAAARLAVDDAGIDLPASRTAVVMGTTNGEIAPLVDITADWFRDGPAVPDRASVRKLPASRLGLAVSRELGLRGEATTLATACAAGNYALGHAFDLLTLGEADVAIAGGADSVNRFVHAGFHRIGALTADRCRPFDADRTGIATAEGGIALVLETLDSARARGARVYAEILGYGMSCDAIHPVAPDADSIARAIRSAHKRSGIAPDQVDYICAHGTGTRANDVVESTAVRAVFGAVPPPMSSVKSMLGHTMGAASGFGAAASALSIHHGFLPPTINHVIPDPELQDIDIVPNEARDADVSIVQNHGFAFFGNNAIIVLGRPE
ncbi:beta-ketoacyl-[acyl-carrier-protein] synthase family protein [Streptomyces sp. NPDC006482]|uniref:beta-ketoacyl-[acyl-carrier-protein] synthase family protein n=1 Tax=Streptomyces sp. NPDC006482 TaxID=3154306 RepID=UPI0033BF0083